jgi:hypothetical protein
MMRTPGTASAKAISRTAFPRIAEIRAGRVEEAASRIGSQKARHDSDERVEANWVAALEGEVALAQREYDRALASFRAARTPAWLALWGDASTVLALNSPAGDGLARLEMSRGNHLAAIAEYRRLASRDEGTRSSAALEPGHVPALARLLDEHGETAAARVEYERFRKFVGERGRGPARAHRSASCHCAP